MSVLNYFAELLGGLAPVFSADRIALRLQPRDGL